MKIFKGQSVANGIVEGNIVLIVSESFVNMEPGKIQEEEVLSEIARFESAIIRSKKQLHSIKNKVKNSLGVSEAGIFHSQILILEDNFLLDKIYSLIKIELVNSEYAVIKIIKDLEEELSNSKSQYLKERVIDLEDIKQRILKNLGFIINDMKVVEKHVNTIAVARTITASDSIELINFGVKALVLEKGGNASHAAILARAMGIPTVVGVDNIINILLEEKGENIFKSAIVDGYLGKLIIEPDEKTKEKYAIKIKKKLIEKSIVCEDSAFPAKTVDGVEIGIYANLGAKFNIENVPCEGGLGVGLYRTEFQYMLRNSFPDEETLVYDYSEMLKKLNNRILTIRLLDVGGDKFLPYYDHPQEKNPELGERSIRFLFKNENILRTQIRAILRASVHGNSRILIPMVSTCYEIIKVKKIMEEEKENLIKNNFKVRIEDIPLGIMVEIPSAVIVLDKIAKHVDFFSIGSNDLIQYTIGVDRESYSIKEYFNPSHPAVLRMIKRCVQVSQDTNKELSICGEMGSEIKYIPLLIGIGMRNLSMNIMNIKDSKDYISSINFSDCSEIADKILEMDDPKDIDNCLEDFKQKYYKE
ncbi:MAG: phosphoenolpyruvate--protein phosphotransferase [Candidatus Muirbacterium halophilum]|nr:phosphoenolpyruvate--protein phosphotransferase [Candidatus Muirbacterium halophilum]